MQKPQPGSAVRGEVKHRSQPLVPCLQVRSQLRDVRFPEGETRRTCRVESSSTPCLRKRDKAKHGDRIGVEIVRRDDALVVFFASAGQEAPGVECETSVPTRWCSSPARPEPAWSSSDSAFCCASWRCKRTSERTTVVRPKNNRHPWAINEDASSFPKPWKSCGLRMSTPWAGRPIRNSFGSVKPDSEATPLRGRRSEVCLSENVPLRLLAVGGRSQASDAAKRQRKRCI